MNIYIDTSALTKKYLEETGSHHLEKLLLEAKHIESSILTELELVSSIEKAKAISRINSPEYRNIFRRFEQDLFNNHISFMQVEPEHWKTAKRLIKQRRLRVGDAIQLACALASQREWGDSLQFLCANHPLLEAARLEGLKVRDVSRD